MCIFLRANFYTYSPPTSLALANLPAKSTQPSCFREAFLIFPKRLPHAIYPTFYPYMRHSLTTLTHHNPLSSNATHSHYIKFFKNATFYVYTPCVLSLCVVPPQTQRTPEQASPRGLVVQLTTYEELTLAHETMTAL